MFVKKIVPLIIIQFLFISCSTNSIDDLDNTEYFEQSLKKLINSINNQDTNRINSLLLKKPSLSNYQELKYGITPLLIAIKNEKYRSAKSLLKLGANPNLCSFDGESPLTCVLHNVISEKSKGFIKHL